MTHASRCSSSVLGGPLQCEHSCLRIGVQAQVDKFRRSQSTELGRSTARTAVAVHFAVLASSGYSEDVQRLPRMGWVPRNGLVSQRVASCTFLCSECCSHFVPVGACLCDYQTSQLRSSENLVRKHSCVLGGHTPIAERRCPEMMAARQDHS